MEYTKASRPEALRNGSRDGLRYRPPPHGNAAPPACCVAVLPACQLLIISRRALAVAGGAGHGPRF